MKKQLFILILTISAVPVLGQSNSDIWRLIHYDFLKPGARAIAMGNSFTAVADDATAAFSNPAGLAFVENQSISFQLSDITTSSPFLLDNTHDAEIFSSAESSYTELSFFAYAFRVKEKFTFSVVYNLANKQDFDLLNTTSILDVVGERVLAHGLWLDEATGDFMFATNGAATNTIKQYGISLSYQINNKISTGISLFLNSNSINYVSEMGIPWTVHPYTNQIMYGAIPYPVSVDHVNEYGYFGEKYIETVDETDNSFALNLGVLYQVSENLTLGLGYYLGPEFKYSAQNIYWVSEIYGEEYAGTYFEGNYSFKYKMPDNINLGVKYYLSDRWMIASDLKYIFYNDSVKNMVPYYSYEVDGEEVYPDPSDYQAENKLEMGVGIEFYGNKFILRAGYYRKYAGNINYTGNILGEQYLFSKLPTTDHYTFGVGYSLTNHWSIDIAYDIGQSSSQNPGDFSLAVIGVNYNF